MFCISLVKERWADGCATYNMAVAKEKPHGKENRHRSDFRGQN